MTEAKISLSKVIETARKIAYIRHSATLTSYHVFLAVYSIDTSLIDKAIAFSGPDEETKTIFSQIEETDTPSQEACPWESQSQKQRIQHNRRTFQGQGISKLKALLFAVVLECREECYQTLLKRGADPEQVEKWLKSIKEKNKIGENETLNLRDRIKTLIPEIKKHVYGQANAVEEVLTSFYRLELTRNQQTSGRIDPLTSLLFVGPPGCGKTYLANSLTRVAKKSGMNIPVYIIAMSSYSRSRTVDSLTGLGSHYQGGKREGELIRAARLSRGNSYIIVFDEIDRACKEAMNLLLSLMSEGYLPNTSSKSQEKVYFNNALLIFTSNASPFSSDQDNWGTYYADIPVIPQEILKEGLKKSKKTDISHASVIAEPSFSDAFLDRLHTIVPFKALGIYEKEMLTKQELTLMQKRLSRAGVEDFSINNDSLLTHIALSAGVKASGRQLIATVKDKIETPIMSRLLWSEEPIKKIIMGYSSADTGKALEKKFFKNIKRILYVEDDNDWQNRVTSALENCSKKCGQAFDLRIEKTISGARDLITTAKWKPDAVLLDLYFPEEDSSEIDLPGGLFFLKEMQLHHPELPVIIISDGLSSEKDEAYWACIKKGGGKGFIAKSAMAAPDQLDDALYKHLRTLGNSAYLDALARSGRRLSLDFQFDAIDNQTLVLWADALDEQPSPTIEDAGWFKVVTGNLCFGDLIGVDSIIDEFRMALSYLKNPDMFAGSGVAPPAGYILHGPPGTGKTSLARALAGEAGALFIACEASEFSKKYVGQGAERVRELFSVARKYVPVVIFIDEIDAFGTRERSPADKSRSHIEVLNAFLSAMDGFSKNDRILVIGATNRVHALDEALTRPGRLGKKVLVDVPRDRNTRQQLVEKYFNQSYIQLDAESLDLAVRLSAGLSPAAVQEWARQVAWIRHKDKLSLIDRRVLVDARNIVCHGESWDVQPEGEGLKRTAYHEAGHGIVSMALGLPVLQISILARSGFLGMMEPFRNQENDTTADLKAKLAVLFGGREAEDLVCEGGFSEGVSNDMKEARKLAERMVCEMGMGDPPLPFGRQGYSGINETAQAAVMSLLKEAQKQARQILSDHQGQLDAIVEKLIKNKTIFEDELV